MDKSGDDSSPKLQPEWLNAKPATKTPFSRFDTEGGPQRWAKAPEDDRSAFQRKDSGRWNEGNTGGRSYVEYGAGDRWTTEQRPMPRGRGAEGEAWKGGPRREGGSDWRAPGAAAPTGAAPDSRNEWRGAERWGSGPAPPRSDSWRSGGPPRHSQEYMGGSIPTRGFAPSNRGQAPRAPAASNFFRSFSSGLGGSSLLVSQEGGNRYSTDDLYRVYRSLLYAGRLRLPVGLERDDPLLFLHEGDFVDVLEQLGGVPKDEAARAFTEHYAMLSRLYNRGGSTSLDTAPSASAPVESAPRVADHSNGNGVAQERKEAGWVYKDPSDVLQGPFAKKDIIEWYEAGYFPLTLSLRSEDQPADAPFTSLEVLLKEWTGGASKTEAPAAAAVPQPAPIAELLPDNLLPDDVSLMAPIQQLNLASTPLHAVDPVVDPSIVKRTGLLQQPQQQPHPAMQQQQPYSPQQQQQQMPPHPHQMHHPGMPFMNVGPGGPHPGAFLPPPPQMHPNQMQQQLHMAGGPPPPWAMQQPFQQQQQHMENSAAPAPPSLMAIQQEQQQRLMEQQQRQQQEQQALMHQRMMEQQHQHQQQMMEAEQQRLREQHAAAMQGGGQAPPPPPPPPPAAPVEPPRAPRPETKPAPWTAPAPPAKSLKDIQQEEAEERAKAKARAAATAPPPGMGGPWSAVARTGLSLKDIQQQEEQAAAAAAARSNITRLAHHEDEDSGDMFWDYSDSKPTGAVAPPPPPPAAPMPRKTGWAAAAAAPGTAPLQQQQASRVTAPPPPPSRPSAAAIVGQGGRPAMPAAPAAAAAVVQAEEYDFEEEDVGEGSGVLTGAFRMWCAEQMQTLTGSKDVTLCEFLMTVESNSEIAEYVTTYLGQTATAAKFSSEFLKRKLAEQAVGTKKSRKSRARANAAAAAANSTSASGKSTAGSSAAVDTSWEKVAKTAASKKKTGQKVDAMLGFASGTDYSLLEVTD